MPDSSYQSRHEMGGNFADLFQSLVSWLSDRAFDSAVEKALKNLESVVRERLSSSQNGALLFVKFYRGPESSKYFHGIDFLAVGLNPNAAYQTYKKSGGIGNAPPKGLLFDEQSSCMVWCRIDQSKSCPGVFKSKMITWPDYQMIFKATYPQK